MCQNEPLHWERIPYPEILVLSLDWAQTLTTIIFFGDQGETRQDERGGEGGG